MNRWNKNTLKPHQLQEPSRPNTFEAPTQSNKSRDSSSAGVDPFLLDFGTSINVTEDLRREIRSEIQEIDAKIAQGTQAHQQEQRVQKQLQQDLHHTFSEMRNLSRGAADRLEDARVHSSFLNGLDNTLNSDIARSTGVLPQCRKSPVSVLDTPKITSLKDSSPNSSSTEKSSSGPSKTNQEILQEKEEMVKNLVQSIQEQKKLGEERRIQNQKWVFEKQQTLDRIQSESLGTVLEQTQEKNQHSKVDVQNESQRHDQLMAKVRSVRSHCGKHAQQLADKTKEIKALRTENKAKLVQMKSKVADASDSVSKQNNALGATKSSQTLLELRMKELAQQEAFYDEFCKARKAQEEALGREEEENKRLLHLLRTLTIEQEKANEELEVSKDAFRKVQKRHEVAVQKEAENNRLEETVMKPGHEEFTRLAQEKEQLATLIGKHHAELVQAQNEHKETLANKKDAKNEVSQQVAQLEIKLEHKQEEIQTTITSREATKRVLEEELSGMIETEETIRSEHQTKMKTLHAAHQAGELASKQSLEAAKEEMKLDVVKDSRYLEIIQIGAKIIEKANEKEENLNEDLVV